ncbi:conserved hypothetical protein [Ixodes scapularis]|uniref:Methyltransferase domain-containing protein n=1 Tax=Ixodes scapularis TaxID=6945 RepID=B7PU12_IXOSC|nr:conserved hypothetical protein [Ixodes scapularis]|eukprot:XP_002405220.1 conserved hypothetical protein [Ixodes scapularis]
MSVKDVAISSTMRPDEYVARNKVQRENSIYALELLEGSFGSDDTSDHQFLDVGCGPGDVTRDCLLPRCPPCRRIVAVDVSEDMVKYAQEHFAHPKICYDVLDIGSKDISDFVERHGEFDRVYSFFSLHWITDQETVLKNVAKLMKPGGGSQLLERSRGLDVLRAESLESERTFVSLARCFPRLCLFSLSVLASS